MSLTTVIGRVAPAPAGGVVVFWGVAIKQWSSAQATVALSSGEAECISPVRAATEGLGVQALARSRVEVPAGTPHQLGCGRRDGGVGWIRHIGRRVSWRQHGVQVLSRDQGPERRVWLSPRSSSGSFIGWANVCLCHLLHA